MTLFKHEIKQGRNSFLIWTLSITFLLVICVFMFPELKGEMDSINEMYSSMGSLTEAFGMDRLNFGTLIGFYAIECGNMLGLGGAFFASLIAILVLAKEEKERTAEFLLTHPISRVRILTEKLFAILFQIFLLNIIVFVSSVASIIVIGEEIPFKELSLIHISLFLMQIELAGICFGISAFIRKGSLGIGLGIAAIMYFFNIIANISDNAEFLKYITPFGYTEGADIVANVSLNRNMVFVGMLYMIIGVIVGYIKYCKKDIK